MKIKIKTLPCPVCGDVAELEVSAEGLIAYNNGELIQNCFPEIPAEDRERMISGMCPDCWNKLFKEEE